MFQYNCGESLILILFIPNVKYCILTITTIMTYFKNSSSDNVIWVCFNYFYIRQQNAAEESTCGNGKKKV